MKKRTFTLRQMAASFLTGALLFSGFSYAAADKDNERENAARPAVQLFLEGADDQLSNDGVFMNGDMEVPDTILKNGTTYVPIRMIAEMLGKPVFWDGANRSVSIGMPHVMLHDAAGKKIGMAKLKQTEEGVVVKIKASGLTPGKHGFHVHEKSIQANDFASAGGHFNPAEKQHGLENPNGSHVGDMPNLIVDDKGKVNTELLIKHATLKKNHPDSILGRSLIVHAGEDDQKSDPAGNSGDRVAGGNIPK